MLEVDYTPSESSPYRGRLRVRIPGYSDRIKLMKSMAFNQDGQRVDLKESSGFDSLEKIHEIFVKHVVLVDLKNEKGAVFKSIEELETHEEFQALMVEVVGMITKGVSAGNA